ncbi:hypothetical protein DINM_000869 [Dirofilaria immitis]|nr:hypothetical protein [Dirofilaria immitis]
MQILEDNKLDENTKLIIINEEIEKATISNTAMEIDKNHELRHICDEIKENAGESDERIIDMNEKQDALVNVNIDSSQISSDKDNNIDSNFVINFIDSSEEVEAAVSEENERNNIADYNNGECESVAGINLKQMQSVSSDLDPTNFFESFTNFVPNLSTMNMSSNAYLSMNTEFDASAIFNFSSVMQNQSGSLAGANDYMALFGAVETNTPSNGSEGFELNFDNLPDGNEVKKGINSANSFSISSWEDMTDCKISIPNANM